MNIKVVHRGKDVYLFTDMLKTKHLLPAKSMIKTPNFPIIHMLFLNMTPHHYLLCISELNFPWLLTSRNARNPATSPNWNVQGNKELHNQTQYAYEKLLPFYHFQPFYFKCFHSKLNIVVFHLYIQYEIFCHYYMSLIIYIQCNFLVLFLDQCFSTGGNFAFPLFQDIQQCLETLLGFYNKGVMMLLESNR